MSESVNKMMNANGYDSLSVIQVWYMIWYDLYDMAMHSAKIY